MKVIILAVCLVAFVVSEEKYKNVNENFNAEDLLDNDRLLLSYTKCLLNKAPCTPEVKQVKDKLPEVLATRCAKCTDRQKQIAKKLIQGLKGKHPDVWKQLTDLYDPQGKHQQAFQDLLKS